LDGDVWAVCDERKDAPISVERKDVKERKVVSVNTKHNTRAPKNADCDLHSRDHLVLFFAPEQKSRTFTTWPAIIVASKKLRNFAPTT